MPSHPSILGILAQIFCALFMLEINSGQSSYVAMRRRPRYFNDYTVSSGLPYAWNAIDSPAHASSSSSCHIFCCMTCVQRAVVGWWRLSAAHRTNIFQAGQRGWYRFPSSRITIMSRTWWCTELIRRLVCVITCPLKPSTGHPTNPAALGEYGGNIIIFV